MMLRTFTLALLLLWTALPLRAEDSGTSLAEDYCANITDQAADARIAWQMENLEKLRDEVTKKITALEAKRAELQGWIEKREQALQAASQELAGIYAKMDPEAAAVQLARIDTATATAILRKLNARGASAILNVMETDRAAALVKAIAAMNRPQAAADGT